MSTRSGRLQAQPERERYRPLGGGGAGVSVRNVLKSCGTIAALRGISLEVAASEFLVITGASGSGKSTLLDLIGSLSRPDSGIVLVAGEPVPEPRQAVSFRRRVVAFVFQDNLLLPYLSARANVEAPLVAVGASRRERRARSDELLDEVGLRERAGHLPFELSGGQRQAVALARALANRPRLLLADEPTGSLDSASARRALDLLVTTRERHGMTVIAVSHDPAVAERADRVVRLLDGRTVPSL